MADFQLSVDIANEIPFLNSHNEIVMVYAILQLPMRDDKKIAKTGFLIAADRSGIMCFWIDHQTVSMII